MGCGRCRRGYVPATTKGLVQRHQLHGGVGMRACGCGFGLVQTALGSQQFDQRNVARRVARLGVAVAGARGIQCHTAALQCVQPAVVVAKRALGIAQRRQHGLLIGQRGLSLGRLACPNFGSHQEIRVSKADYQRRNQTALQLLAEAESRCGARLIEPATRLCPGDYCQIEQEGRSLYYDDDHLSGRGARLLLPLLEQALTAPR